MVSDSTAFYVANMPTDLAAMLAGNLRAIRKRRKLTQEQFAELTGWTQGEISELENGKRLKYLRTVGDVLAGAGIDPAELLVSEAEPLPADVAEAIDLLQRVDPTARAGVLLILRSSAAKNQSASG